MWDIVYVSVSGYVNSCKKTKLHNSADYYFVGSNLFRYYLKWNHERHNFTRLKWHLEFKCMPSDIFVQSRSYHSVSYHGISRLRRFLIFHNGIFFLPDILFFMPPAILSKPVIDKLTKGRHTLFASLRWKSSISQCHV